ncbi:hypothetical protein ACFSW8_09890 [Rubritalea tangerina]|uniref:Metallopeptidase domain-containing protein n=2 Tax=Rubritalea tangerina TaxID=430798 RepID=A0ABW4ZB48_9BACT
MPSYHPDLQTFLVPLSERELTLREALDKLEAIGNEASEVPFIVQMMENPGFSFPPFSMFKGRVSLFQHDCIHLLLGRGTTLIDEAFTIGFTMGSSNAMSTTASKIFGYVAGHWYPKAYRFPPHANKVYEDAVHLGMVSECVPLELVDYHPYMDWKLGALREELGIEVDLLESYYRVEAARNPDIAASQRLCPQV